MSGQAGHDFRKLPYAGIKGATTTSKETTVGGKKQSGRASQPRTGSASTQMTRRGAKSRRETVQGVPDARSRSKGTDSASEDVRTSHGRKSGNDHHASRAFAISVGPAAVATVLATVLSLIFAGVPFIQSLLSGPKYEMRKIDVGMSVDTATGKGLSTTAYVITNVGDERGNLVSVIHEADEDMRVCFPDIDNDGGIRTDEEGHGTIHMLGKRVASLDPGQAQIMFFVSPVGQTSLIETQDGPALAYRTPLLGESYILLDTEDKRTRIHTSSASDEFSARFIEDPLYSEALEGCKRLVDLERRNMR